MATLIVPCNVIAAEQYSEKCLGHCREAAKGRVNRSGSRMFGAVERHFVVVPRSLLPSHVIIKAHII